MDACLFIHCMHILVILLSLSRGTAFGVSKRQDCSSVISPDKLVLPSSLAMADFDLARKPHSLC